MCAFGAVNAATLNTHKHTDTDTHTHTQGDLTGRNSHQQIVIGAPGDALLTLKPRPLTVTRHCLTTYVPAGSVAKTPPPLPRPRGGAN